MEVDPPNTCPLVLQELLRKSIEKFGEDFVKRLCEKSCKVHHVSCSVERGECRTAAAAGTGITLPSRLGRVYVPDGNFNGASAGCVQIRCVSSSNPKAPFVGLEMEDCSENEGWNTATRGKRGNLRGGAGGPLGSATSTWSGGGGRGGCRKSSAPEPSWRADATQSWTSKRY